MDADSRKPSAPKASVPDVTLTRRELIKTSALLGGSGLFAAQVPGALQRIRDLERPGLTPTHVYQHSAPENLLYTACLQCNTGCGIKVKLEDGVAAKIDGSAYNPFTFLPHVPYKTRPEQVAGVDGGICPKGQAGVQSVYDPYRIVKVLKRAGKRGSNQWTTIPFDQAVREIVEGGLLFKHVPGEEKRQVAGLRKLWAVRDPAMAKALADDAKALMAKKLTVAEFKAKHAQNLDLLIDPDHPDFGPKNNQLVFAWGRLKAGRGDLISRFTRA